MKRLNAMIHSLIALHFAVSSLPVAASIPIPAPAKKKSTEAPAQDQVTQGSVKILGDGRIEVIQSGLIMTPPSGWNLRENFPGVSVVLESPEKTGTVNRYRRTLQIRTGSGPRFLDTLGIKDFEDEMTEKLGRQGEGVTEFSVRNSEVVKTADGRDALLTYAGFNLNGFEMMQAHLLISNVENHTVITYTDLAENFENTAPESPLGEAWASMTSTNFPGKNPERFAGPIQIAAIAGILIVLISAAVTIRNAISRRALLQTTEQNTHDLNTDSSSGNPLSGDVVALSSSPSNLSTNQPTSLQSSIETPLNKVA
jgi:hypothetical protein